LILPLNDPDSKQPTNPNIVKNLRRRLSARYLNALRSSLDGKRADHEAGAQVIGRAAQAGDLRTLDMAIMHERAVMALLPSHDFANTRNGLIRRAGVFFAEALSPLEAAQQVTRNLNRTLQRRAKSLVAGTHRLKKEILRRKAGEAVVRKSQERYKTLFLESQALRKKLRNVSHQVILAHEEERKEISRELHDEIAQALVGINVELAALGKSASVGYHSGNAKIVSAQRLVRNSVKMLHRFARDLRPPELDDFGLIPALHTYNKNLALRRKLKITLTAFGGVEALGIAKRTVLYRVAQEALTNVVRHARATEVKITIRETTGAVLMEISDNGRSFDVTKAFPARNRTRLGLIGMRERIEMFGGVFTIKPAVGGGTVVSAEIPFPEKKSHK
jgi:signal transduction histidine kinase